MSNSVELHINRDEKLKILDFFNLQNLTNTIPKDGAPREKAGAEGEKNATRFAPPVPHTSKNVLSAKSGIKTLCTVHNAPPPAQYS